MPPFIFHATYCISSQSGRGCSIMFLIPLPFFLPSPVPSSSLCPPLSPFNLSYKLFLSEVKLLSHVQLFATPWTIAYRAPRSMEFSRQEYWSGLPFPSPLLFLEPTIYKEWLFLPLWEMGDGHAYPMLKNLQWALRAFNAFYFFFFLRFIF